MATSAPKLNIYLPRPLFPLPNLRSLPWYLGIVFPDPAITFPLSIALTAISAVGAAWTHHTRDQNKGLYRTLCATTAVGLIATAWTCKNYWNRVVSYR